LNYSRVFVIILLVFGSCSLAAFQMYSHSMPFSLAQAHNPLGFGSQPSPLARGYQVYPYDEQVGETFTQDFTSLSFNVTAVAQTGSDGVGPAYLLNGLTNAGYWYQIGISWNWPHSTGGYNAGFSMNYEVFNPYGTSVFPLAGGGGIQAISVNAGDTVLLSLNFSTGNVLMQAHDFNTGSSASQMYSASYASYFIGLSSSNSQNGFFTGLMTEQYHSQPYYGTGQPVTYASSDINMSSAWMWMDEFNTATGQTVFQDGTTSPVLFDNPTLFQYFSTNGTAEVSSPKELVTGLSPIQPLSIESTNLPAANAGERAPFTLRIKNPSLLNAKITGLKASTSLGNFNTSATLPFTINTQSANFTVAIILPASLYRGNLTVTIRVSWQFLDTRIDRSVTLADLTTGATLQVNGSTAPPPPGSNPPPTGPTTPPSTGQPKSQNTTSGLVTRLRGVLIPVALGFIVLVTLAVVMVVREETRPRPQSGVLLPQFCITCGGQTNPTMLFCPNCGHPNTTLPQEQSSAPFEKPSDTS